MDLSRGVPGVDGPDPTSFEEFWPYYVSQHLHPRTRRFHVVGTTLGLGWAVVAALLRRPRLLALSPALGYGPAWYSHFAVEGNKPASFGHPAWSARGDFRMVARFFSGRLQRDVDGVRTALRMAPTEMTLAERNSRSPLEQQAA
jgi:hypothetical protein